MPGLVWLIHPDIGHGAYVTASFNPVRPRLEMKEKRDERDALKRDEIIIAL